MRLGVSMSGENALDVALEHPELVAALVLVSATPSGFAMQGEPPGRSRSGTMWKSSPYTSAAPVCRTTCSPHTNRLSSAAAVASTKYTLSSSASADRQANVAHHLH